MDSKPTLPYIRVPLAQVNRDSVYVLRIPAQVDFGSLQANSRYVLAVQASQTDRYSADTARVELRTDEAGKREGRRLVNGAEISGPLRYLETRFSRIPSAPQKVPCFKYEEARYKAYKGASSRARNTNLRWAL